MIITDLGSTYGTFVDGQKKTPKQGVDIRKTCVLGFGANARGYSLRKENLSVCSSMLSGEVRERLKKVCGDLGRH